jgi:hypothetical protein
MVLKWILCIILMSLLIKEISIEYCAYCVKFSMSQTDEFFPIWQVPAPLPKQGKKHWMTLHKIKIKLKEHNIKILSNSVNQT